MKMSDLHENAHASGTNFHMNGFALIRLVLKKRQKSTRKWPIALEGVLVSVLKGLVSRSRSPLWKTLLDGYIFVVLLFYFFFLCLVILCSYFPLMMLKIYCNKPIIICMRN